MGHLQPAEIEVKELNLITDLTISAIKALNLDNCACHTEIKLNSKGAFLIENSPRLGGDFITSYLTPLSTGVNIEAAVINMATGNIPNLTITKFEYSAVEFLHLNEGFVKSISDWSNVLEIPGIIKARIRLKKNQRIKKISNSLERYGYVIAHGHHRNDVILSINEGIKFLKSKIKII